VYVPAYEDRKVEFIDELHYIMSTWQGPILVGGDFILCRIASDKNNGKINQKIVDCFNVWINRWGMIELNPFNRRYTWSNNQSCPVLAKLDRVFASTDWSGAFPLVRVEALPKEISDHAPLLVDSGSNCTFGKKNFRLKNGG
jgi:hypothetical protein